MIKIKSRHIFSTGMQIIYMVRQCRKVSSNNFEWIEDTFQFNKDFIENYNEESDEGCFLEVVQHLEKLHELHMIYLFYLKD